MELIDLADRQPCEDCHDVAGVMQGMSSTSTIPSEQQAKEFSHEP
jgi:hypothetical protein